MEQPSETQRVAAALSRKIRGMQPGDDLGSLSSVAADFQVGRDVARKAMALLTRHGLVRAEARRHVVADPAAPLTDSEAIADLQRRVAELERRLPGADA